MISCNSLESLSTENSTKIMCAKPEWEKSSIKFFKSSTLVSTENSARIMCGKPEWVKSPVRYFKSALSLQNKREVTRSAATTSYSLPNSVFSFGYPMEGDHKQLRPFGYSGWESPDSIYLRRQRYVRSYAFKKPDTTISIFETVLEKAKTCFKEKNKGNNQKDDKARSGKSKNSCCSNCFKNCFKLLSCCTVQVDVISSPKKKVHALH